MSRADDMIDFNQPNIKDQLKFIRELTQEKINEMISMMQGSGLDQKTQTTIMGYMQKALHEKDKLRKALVKRR